MHRNLDWIHDLNVEYDAQATQVTQLIQHLTLNP